MVRGLYTSTLGMTTQQKKMDVVSNNIANVNTTGYKKDFVVSSAFDEELAKRTHDLKDKNFAPIARSVGNITYGVYVDEVFTDFSTGSIRTTNGTYDLAISGNGFFVVNTTERNGSTTEKYTRDGAFAVNENRYLVTKDGGFVSGRNGNIYIPDGSVNIEKNGDITVNNQYVDTIRTIDFEDNKTLRKQADNYYVRTDATTESPFNGEVVQGALEMSNVNTVKEMVDLITISRTYEANQKVIQTIDTTLQRSVTEIGRKG